MSSVVSVVREVNSKYKITIRPIESAYEVGKKLLCDTIKIMARRNHIIIESFISITIPELIYIACLLFSGTRPAIKFLVLSKLMTKILTATPLKRLNLHVDYKPPINIELQATRHFNQRYTKEQKSEVTNDGFHFLNLHPKLRRAESCISHCCRLAVGLKFH